VGKVRFGYARDYVRCAPVSGIRLHPVVEDSSQIESENKSLGGRGYRMLVVPMLVVRLM
jgi:hypothetical protein